MDVIHKIWVFACQLESFTSYIDIITDKYIEYQKAGGSAFKRTVNKKQRTLRISWFHIISLFLVLILLIQIFPSKGFVCDSTFFGRDFMNMKWNDEMDMKYYECGHLQRIDVVFWTRPICFGNHLLQYMNDSEYEEIWYWTAASIHFCLRFLNQIKQTGSIFATCS